MARLDDEVGDDGVEREECGLWGWDGAAVREEECFDYGVLVGEGRGGRDSVRSELGNCWPLWRWRMRGSVMVFECGFGERRRDVVVMGE